MTARRVILCMNSGSSSLKFALYQLTEAVETSLADGAVERIGLPGGRLWIRTAVTAPVVDEPGGFRDHHTAVHNTLAALEQLRLPAPDAVGHRIVHGGAEHIAPERVDHRLMEDLRRLVAYAPLHLLVVDSCCRVVSAHPLSSTPLQNHGLGHEHPQESTVP